MNLLRDLAQLYLIQKANPFHAADGRFTSASGRGSSKATYVSTGDKFKTAIANAKELQKSRSEKARELINTRSKQREATASKPEEEFREDNSSKVADETKRLREIYERNLHRRTNIIHADHKRRNKYGMKTGNFAWGYEGRLEADPRIQSRNSLYYKSFGKSIARNERKTGKSHTVDGEENWTSKHYNSKRSGVVNPYGHENPKLLTNEMIKQHGSKSKAARAILKDYEENVPKKIRDNNQRDVNRSERASHYRTKKSELLSRLVYLYS